MTVSFVCMFFAVITLIHAFVVAFKNNGISNDTKINHLEICAIGWTIAAALWWDK